MVISLLVLLIPVVLFVGVYQALAGRNRPIEVDPQSALTAAAAAGMAVAEPADLPEGWVPVSAVFRPGEAGGTLRIGYAVQDGRSAQLLQSTAPAEQLLPAELPEPATPAGTVELAGRSWQIYPPRGAGGERALVLLAPEQTTIVRGTVSEAALRELATALAVR